MLANNFSIMSLVDLSFPLYNKYEASVKMLESRSE